MGAAFQSGANGVDPAQVEAEMMRSMAGNLGTQAWIGVGISLFGLFLFIASFARRLRDAGLPVLIAIIPVATVLISAYFSVASVGEMSELMASGNVTAMEEAAAAKAPYSLIGYAGYLVVIICGLIPTKKAG